MDAGPTAPDEICVIEDGHRIIKAETILDNPDSYKLVHAGHAESADDECRDKVATMHQQTRGKLREIHVRMMSELEDFQDGLQADDADDEIYDEPDDEDDEEPAS